MGRGMKWEKSVGGWKWYKYCVHIYVDGKMRPVETILWMGGEGIKESDGGNELKYDIFDIL
jgi:hypothetical protein